MPKSLFFLLMYLVVLATPLSGALRSTAITPVAAPSKEHPVMVLLQHPMNDPLEKFNRFSESVNSVLVRYALHPASIVYNRLVPETVRFGLINFADNLLFPLHAVANCLQGEFGSAWEEAKRFGINTTVGLLGFRDKATEMGYKRHREDFGKTFATWGMGPGCYLNLPLLGPTTVRDALGSIPDALLNPAFYVVGANTVLNSNRAFSNAGFLNSYFRSRRVTYPVTRMASVLSRKAQLHYGIFTTITCAPDESLGILNCVPRDRLFYTTAYNREITPPGAAAPLPYSLFRHQVFDGRIMFVLPGLNSTRVNSDIVAMAEMFHRDGWTVAVLSSTFTREFFLAFNCLPGDLEGDCERLDAALTAIRDAIVADEKKSAAKFGTPFPETIRTQVFGVSLGAINTLFLAARDHTGKSMLNAERFIAVNPPRNPLQALKKLDSFFDVPMSWPEEKRLSRTQETLEKLGYTAMADEGQAIPGFDYDESLFLFGLESRFGLIELMDAAHGTPLQSHFEPVVRMDTVQNRETDGLLLTYEKYLEDVFLPFMVSRGALSAAETLDHLSRKSAIDSLADHLKTNEKIRFFHTRNDLLLDAGDIDWYEALFAGRITVFPTGSHLGHMANRKVQDIIVSASR